MSVQEKTNQIRLKHWTQVVQQCKSSGIPTKDWIRDHGITKDQYYYWQRKVRKAAIAIAEESNTQIVELEPQTREIASPVSMHAASSLHLSVKGMDLAVTEATSPQLLRMVLREIQNV